MMGFAWQVNEVLDNAIKRQDNENEEDEDMDDDETLQQMRNYQRRKSEAETAGVRVTVVCAAVTRTPVVPSLCVAVGVTIHTVSWPWSAMCLCAWSSFFVHVTTNACAPPSECSTS